MYAIRSYYEAWLAEAIDEIERADAIVWSTPVYTMLVPWQLIRLFRLVEEAGRSDAFRGKYATSMMTCFHYYDHLAEAWLRATCEDLGMAYMEGRTADNMDMLRKDHRRITSYNVCYTKLLRDRHEYRGHDPARLKPHGLAVGAFPGALEDIRRDEPDR